MDATRTTIFVRLSALAAWMSGRRGMPLYEAGVAGLHDRPLVGVSARRGGV